ncbi:Wzz/FepE/Etk N-terminal domain-containing protein [Viridibacillus sp. FSL R5-0477]|uniref:Lipopolysaccharide biosynthesis protein n=1 Tax=Viridibacillus arenosi FSL R5-213 TaxID=1227360 RepID=W4EYI8_9BACL|nr:MULTISPECIES: Wzz/FepE/Etk N-terminal domain-containing protein [Viridibacillus]ETT85289.1 lipopolysaccharide biosynthesis protein [Viridibacillus arenosi FSL R5-213]OMC80991.1 capsular biosynthesis protein [Viridibacillus sp. FSL H8-0123]OMC86575.1 capsular biosynthesis protein [Viridibacillus sp. FSL H7-0596]OMC89351.1 capsular biosynthesis protein [Viridibacillus arenosi]
MEETISLHDIFKTLKKRLLLIITTFVLAISIAGGVSYFLLTPVYEASTQILISQKEIENKQFIAQDVQTNLQLINTYSVIIKSPVILSKVVDNLNLNTRLEVLNNNINVSSEQDSQVINISVQDPDLQKAVEIANMTAEVFQKDIPTLMNVDNVKILSPAVDEKNVKPIRPNPILNMAIAALIGLMIGVGIAFLIEYLDKTIKTEQDVSELLELQILGLISPISQKKFKKSKKNNKKRGELDV